MIEKIQSICSTSGDRPRWCRLVWWFMTPEDTTLGARHPGMYAAELASPVHPGRAKALFWTGLSIATAVLVSFL